MKIYGTIFALVTFLFLFTSCAPNQIEVEKLYEDGVEVVLNHLQPYAVKGEPSSFYLEEESMIDFSSEEIAEMGIADADDFDVAADGTIYFHYPHKNGDLVFQFGENGNYEASFGSKGQGPGEIQFVLLSGIDSQQNLIISDHVNKKVIRYRKNGELINEIRYPESMEQVYPLDNGNYLALSRKLSDPNDDFYWHLITLLGADFKKLKVLDRYKYPRPAKKGYRGVNSNYFFSWRISKEQFFIGNEDREYEFLVFDLEGNLLRKIRKEYTPVKVPSELIKTRKDRYKNAGVKMWFPEYYLPICDYFPDDEGRLYVMTFEKGENESEYWYDIFNTDGVFIGKESLKIFTWGEIRASAKAKNGKLYCFEEKDDGFRVFKVYKMIWE